MRGVEKCRGKLETVGDFAILLGEPSGTFLPLELRARFPAATQSNNSRRVIRIRTGGYGGVRVRRLF
jgi:hypothetical protein